MREHALDADCADDDAGDDREVPVGVGLDRTPGPPQQREDKQALEHPQRVVRVHHVAGHLCHGEHVDEVEELEGGDGIVFAGEASAAEDPERRSPASVMTTTFSSHPGVKES